MIAVRVLAGIVSVALVLGVPGVALSLNEGEGEGEGDGDGDGDWDGEQAAWLVGSPQGPAWIAGNQVDAQNGCGGTAPFEYWCTLGSFSGDGPPTVGCQAGSGYTGTIETIRSWSNGESWFICTFVNGALTAAQGGGSFPPVGAQVRVECWSYQEGTAGLFSRPNGLGPVFTLGPWQGDEQAQTDPQGLPGGDGSWACADA